MGRKHSSCPLGACEKFFKATAFRKIRRISNHPQPPVPANSTLPLPSFPLVKAEAAQHLKTPKNKEAAEVKPFSSSLHAPQNEKAKPATVQALFKNGQAQAATAAPKTEPLSHNVPVEKVKVQAKVGSHISQPGNHLKQANIEPKPSQVNRVEGSEMGASIEDRCADYINRTGIRLRATSNVGHDGKSSVAGEEKKINNDHFSDYINRAKLKIRTMSSFVGGRSDSIK